MPAATNTRRSKRPAPPVPTREEMERALHEIDRIALECARVESTLEDTKTDLAEKLKTAKDEASENLRKLTAERDLADGIVQRWSIANKATFKGQSITLYGVQFGWRKDKPSVRLKRPKGETKKQTLKGLLTALQKRSEVVRKKFIRVKEEVNKEGILSHYKEHAVLLDNLGVEIANDEHFFTDPKAAKPVETEA